MATGLTQRFSDYVNTGFGGLNQKNDEFYFQNPDALTMKILNDQGLFGGGLGTPYAQFIDKNVAPALQYIYSNFAPNGGSALKGFGNFAGNYLNALTGSGVPGQDYIDYNAMGSILTGGLGDVANAVRSGAKGLPGATNGFEQSLFADRADAGALVQDIGKFITNIAPTTMSPDRMNAMLSILQGSYNDYLNQYGPNDTTHNFLDYLSTGAANFITTFFGNVSSLGGIFGGTGSDQANR